MKKDSYYKYIEPVSCERLRLALIQKLHKKILEVSHDNLALYTRNSSWVDTNTDFKDRSLSNGKAVWQGESDRLPDTGHVMWDYIVLKKDDLLWRILITSGYGIQIALFEDGEKVREKFYDYRDGKNVEYPLRYNGKNYDILEDYWEFIDILSEICVKHMQDCNMLEDLNTHTHTRNDGLT